MEPDAKSVLLSRQPEPELAHKVPVESSNSNVLTDVKVLPERS